MLGTGRPDVMRLVKAQFYKNNSDDIPAKVEWTWLPPSHSLHAFSIARTMSQGFACVLAEVEMELAIGDKEVGQ